MNIHWFQHVPFEGLGSIEGWILRRGHTLSVTRFYQQDSLPKLDSIDWLIVMGGPMNIYEDAEYPWLASEREFIKMAIETGKIVLGICLGAQLIADALGSKVCSGRYKEIGWFPIRKTDEARDSAVFRQFPQEMYVFHWHGDTFDLPLGSLHIAESTACRSQAFIYENRVVGLQFHLEMTQEGVVSITDRCRNEIVEAPYIQNAEEIISGSGRFTETNREMDRLLDRLSRNHSG